MSGDEPQAVDPGQDRVGGACDTSPNAEWHRKHRMPPRPTLDQRVKWHIEHARQCPCPPADDDIREELTQRYRGRHQDFWIDFTVNDQKALGLWAADCADHLLPHFEDHYPDDPRPREAIRTLRAWVATGQFSMRVIRAASLAAHAAARDVRDKDTAACCAARAAGQAVGTAHVPTHALGPVLYALRLVAATSPTDVKAATARERAWQAQHLPDHLRPWVKSWVVRTQQRLPQHLRTHLE
jgi:hypothetical protein